MYGWVMRGMQRGESRGVERLKEEAGKKGRLPATRGASLDGRRRLKGALRERGVGTRLLVDEEKSVVGARLALGVRRAKLVHTSRHQNEQGDDNGRSRPRCIDRGLMKRACPSAKQRADERRGLVAKRAKKEKRGLGTRARRQGRRALLRERWLETCRGRDATKKRKRNGRKKNDRVGEKEKQKGCRLGRSTSSTL